jgi:Cd2+/Zn2+-exporting ATPase/Cu+-exporting ATPase
MDCAECVQHVEHAVASVAGVLSVQVYLASEKAVVHLTPQASPLESSLPAIRQAVAAAGYQAGDPLPSGAAAPSHPASPGLSRPALIALGGLFALVLVVVIAGEWLGWSEALGRLIPWPVWAILALVGGWPIFVKVARASLHRQVISHTLMTIGVLAAAAVGQWVTAVIVVLFMRVGDFV